MIFKRITAPETYPLRLSVLKTCDKYIYQYQGDFEKTTVHFGIFSKDILIGIVSVMEKSNPLLKHKQFQLRGMAVSKDFQEKGVGGALITKVKEFCIENNADILWCNARAKAVNFYIKQGFNILGEIFYIEHVGNHFMMTFEF